MAFKDNWRPRIDNVDDADASAVNEIAEAVIENEQAIENIVESVHDISQEVKENTQEIQNISKEINQNKEANQIFSNALKGSATGSAVRIEDASPIEHDMAVRVSSKNLFNNHSKLTKVLYENGVYTQSEADTKTPFTFIVVLYANGVLKLSKTKQCTDIGKYSITFTWDGDDTISTVRTGLSGEKTNNFVDFAMNLTKGTYTLSWDLLNTVQGSIAWTDVQLEQGTTATEYTPYVEPSGVKVQRYGKNLLNADGCLGNALTKDGDIFTLSNSSGERFSATGAIYIPANTPITIGVDILEYTGTHTYAFNFRFADESGALEYHYLTVANHKKKITLGIAATSVSFYLQGSNDAVQLKFKNPQIELSDTATAYEPYTELTEYTVNADGSVNGVQPLQPTTTLLTDTEGAVIDVEYNRDINKAFVALESIVNAMIGV